MENDENYVPYTRSKYKLPDEKFATKVDYLEIFEETPIYTFYRIFVMQALSVRLFSGDDFLADLTLLVVGGFTSGAYLTFHIFQLSQTQSAIWQPKCYGKSKASAWHKPLQSPLNIIQASRTSALLGTHFYPNFSYLLSQVQPLYYPIFFYCCGSSFYIALGGTSFCAII